ncbi:MAG: N-acetyltransferase family protein [Sulfuricellaceae bacterium]|jgi:GNAT superfamily N-acetyltransferase
MSQGEFDAAREADIPAMVALLGELFRLEGDFEPDAVKQERGLRMILEQPLLGRLFVARINGQVAAMASLLFTVSTAEGGRVGLVEDVIVAASWRGQGLGRGLLDHVTDWARANGCLRLTLLADRENMPALDFYRRLGFRRSAMVVLRCRT